MLLLSEFSQMCFLDNFIRNYFFDNADAYIFRGDLTEISAKGTTACSAVPLFSKLNKIFFGYFDPENTLLDDKNRYFSGWPNRYFG